MNTTKGVEILQLKRKRQKLLVTVDKLVTDRAKLWNALEAICVHYEGESGLNWAMQHGIHAEIVAARVVLSKVKIHDKS